MVEPKNIYKKLTYPFSFHPTADNLEAPVLSGVESLQANGLDEVSLARHVVEDLGNVRCGEKR